MKITKHGIKFNVNAYEGSLIGYWIRALLILYLNIKVDNYFRKVKNGTYEEPTFLIMNKYLDKKHSIIDIGAWRGTMTLYACQLARHCYAVEPDPISFNALKSNIELNSEIQDKITVCNAAIFSHTGLVNLSARFAFDQSITSTIKRYDSYNIKIPSFTLPDFVKKYKIDDCNFIKIDTEGAEVAILPKAFEFLKNKKPVIYLAFHPQHFPDFKKDIRNLLKTVRLYTYAFDMKQELISPETIERKLLKKNQFDILLTDRYL